MLKLARRGTLAAVAAAAAGALALLPSLPAAAVLQAGAVVHAGEAADPGPGTALGVIAADVSYQQQWVFSMLDVEQAWSRTEGSGVTVAVIDSGVYPFMSDLEGLVTSGPDYTGLSTPRSDANWGQHGTWMASIIAGDGHDGGLIGVAPEAKILSVRVIPDSTDPGYRHYDDEPEEQIQDELAKGIVYAAKHGAQVISMSIGYSAPSGVVRSALQYAYAKGVVLVASSGNSGTNDSNHGLSPVSFPAEYPGVLSVGAVDSNGQNASFSSGNLSVQVAAPGNYVPAQGRDGQFYTVNGTSPACALVAGVAALIKGAYPGISPALVIQAITSTAKQSLPGGAYNVHTGFGIVDADAALMEAGRLLKEHPAGSQASLTGHFGGGAAAVPAPPVSSRGPGARVFFSVLGGISLLAAGAAGFVLWRRGRPPRYRPGHG
jgi:subtilisin family serine protease